MIDGISITDFTAFSRERSFSASKPSASCGRRVFRLEPYCSIPGGRFGVPVGIDSVILLTNMDQAERDRLKRKARNLSRLDAQIVRQDNLLEEVLPRTQHWQGASESVMIVIRELFRELSEALSARSRVYCRRCR
jgi:hypothetical protein